MLFETGIIPEELQGSYFEDPTLDMPKTDTGLLDLLSATGATSQSAPEDPIKNSLENFANTPATATALSAPQYFDWDRSQADRYVNSRHYKQLGFNPNIGQENEYKYGAAQTWGDVWSNGLTGMFKLAGNTFIEGWKGWGHMANALFSWDSSKLVGTPEDLMAQDKETKDIMNKYAIFETPESEKGIFNRSFFGTMLQQSGFAVGTIGQFLSEELLTMGLSTEFSLAKLGMKEASWLGKVVTKAEVVKDMKKLGDSVWKSRTIGEGIVQAARKFVPLYETGHMMAAYGKAGAGALQIAAIGVGGIRRTLAEANMAITEARMEAAGTYGDLYSKLYDEELFKTGQMPSAQLLEKMKQNSLDAASDNFKVNTGLLMVMNRLQFDNLFSKFKFGRSVLGEGGGFADDVIKVTGKAAGKEAGEELTKTYAKGAFGTFSTIGKIAADFGGKKAAWEATKAVGKNVFKWEASEGIQELFQEGSNVALQDYYYDLYHGYKGGLEKSVMKGVESQATTQGLKTFLMGALTGRLLSPINFAIGKAKLYGGTDAKQRNERKIAIEDAVKQVNAFYENPNKYLPEHIANIKVQNKAAQNMEEAIANKDEYVFHNSKDSAFAKMLSSAIKVGMFDSVIDTLRGYGDVFNDKTNNDFKEAFGMEATDTNRASVKEFFNKIADEATEFHKTWKTLKDRFGDRVKTDLYLEGSESHTIALMAQKALDDAIEMLATNDYKAKRNTIRAAKLQTEVGSHPVIGGSSATAFRNLGVIQNTEKEIELLQNEITATEAIPKKDKATKDLLKSKKAQLKALQAWKENHPSLKLMGRKEKRKFNKAIKAFENYMNSKNQESGLDVVLKSDDVQDIYEKLIDYIDLNNDNKEYVDAYNILANPIQFVNVHKRLMDAMEAVRLQKLKEHLEELVKEAQGKPPINPPGAPSGKHKVVVQQDGKFSVVSPKGSIVAKDIENADEAQKIADELDVVLAGQGGGSSSSTPDKPNNLSKDAVVKDKGEGIYLIEEVDKDGNKFYYIADKENKPVSNIELDDEKYPNYDPAMGYEDYNEAKLIFDALQEQIAKDKGEYMFDGKKIAAGTILVNDKGRKFKVVTKGKPLVVAGISKITIVPLEGAAVSTVIENLKGYRLESEVESATTPDDPNAFRLLRNNELIKIYPHQENLPDGKRESREAAEKRLNELILNTPQAALLAGLSIVVTKNTNLGQPYFASYTNGQNPNKHLQVQPEPYSIQLVYNGKPIGYIPNYNQYKYIDNTGARSDIDVINKQQFLQIFNPEDKNVDKELEDFKKNYKKAREVYTRLINELKTGDQVVLDPAKVSDLFYVNSSSGEYDFVDKEEDKVSFDQLQHNTINGFTYIIDRRKKYKKGDQFETIETIRVSSEASLDEIKAIEKKIEQARRDINGNDKLNGPAYGRYVGVVEMPNGDIKFVNLTAAAMDKLTLDSFAEKINEVSKKLKETNSREAVDKNTKKTFFEAIDPYAANDINEELSNALYVALKTKGMAGMNVTLIVTPTGNIKVDFGIRYRDSNSSIKGEVYLYQSENDKSVPFELKDFDDLIARINKGIDEYNANPSNSNSTDKTKLKNIPIRLLSSSFKRSVMDNSEIGEYRQLLSSVGAAITKNPNLTITPKFKQNAPSNSSTTAATVDDIDEVPIPEDIAAQQVETMRKLAEAKRKKQEEEEKRKQQAGGAKNKNEKIAELRQAYDDRIREISNEKMAAGKTRAEVNRELRTVEDPKKGDPKILQILQEIAALQQGTANKIANNLTTSEVVDINEFTKWVEQNLPEFISVEDLKLMSRKMKQNGVTVGMFYTHMNNIKNQLEGRIAVGKKSPFKYHEAFHAVFRMLLPDDKIDELLSIAKKELLAKGESVADLKRKLLESKPEFYSQFSDIELEQRVYEEYLADRFDAWKRDIKTPTSSKNKGFFRYLWDLISGLFKAFRNSDSLENFFMKIEKGKYKKSQIASNRFTSESLVSVTEPALKVIKIGTDFIENEYGEMEEVPVYLGEEEGNVLSATVAALFHRKMMEAGLNAYNENILDEVIADYANLYDFNLNPYYDSDEFLERYENPVEFKKIEKKINDRFKIFTNPELIKIFKDAAMVHIKLMGYKEQIDEEEFERKVDEYGDRSSTDGRRETYTIGGYGSLSKELRLYLSTVVEEKADEFGNTMFINDKGEKTTQTIIEAANANVLYQGILKAVAGSVTEEQILERLRIFSESNPEAKKFWNKFSGDVDLVYDENGDFVDVGNKKQANLFQAVMKGFSQFCVDYLFINKDISKRKSRILEANRRGAARNQFSIWYNAYDNIFVEKFYHLDREKQDKFIDDRTKSLVYITNWFGSPLNPAVIDAKIQETIIGLKNDLGISLSPLYLKYSYLKSLPAEYFNDLTKPERAAQLRIINAYDGVTPLTKDDALQIAAVIKARKNPFGDNLDPSKLAAVEESTNPKAAHETPAESKENPLTDADSQQEERDVDDDVDGARGRLTNIAEGNAVFDEQVASTSHKNAEGEMVFSHQLPTFNLIRGAELRSEDFREKLKKDKFLTTNFLLNSPLFQAIASGFKIIRSDGLKDSSLSEIEDGKYKEDKRLNINQNKGITYGSMSPREFMITLLELYGRNKTYTVATENNKAKPFMTSAVLLGVLEASNTGDIAELPVIKSVLFDAKGNLKLTDEAKEALFNEVMREYDRITRVQTEISTGVYEKGIIDGYHTGDPNNKKNPGKRGLRFIKMRNMLGDRVAQLEEAAKQGLELTADEKSIIYQQIEEYWLGENGELNKFIKDLKKTNTIGQDKEGKYNNRLLNSFAFSGFWKDGKPDQIKNDLLNLSTTSFEYNMAQIVINNYINVLSVRQLFINDAAKNYKDDGGKDETKRNKGLNGAGPSSYAIITAPELGITHANKTSHVVTYEDNQYDGKYKGKRDSKEDGQMRMTVKALRYTLFGFGRLNQAQADLLDKIERGEDLKVSDIFGEEYKDAYGITRKKKGSIEFNAQTNSIKLVYNDGQNYIKISGVILTKQLTSIKDRRTGKWMARPETEELHNLREKLEDYESRNSTITFAVPKSGSKGLKTNVAKDINSINDDSFIEHDNRFWRLQLENPSNKIKITDPTQAKQMILSEQERDLVVHFKGENMKLGDVIDQYLSDTEQRTTNKYTAARNTIFDIKGAFRELKKSIKQSEITPKLGEFLNRAVGILEATGTDPQTIQFFTPTLNEKTGEYTPNYNLNHPITLEKFTQLFLAYFSRDVMNEKVPGHSVALMSNFGMKTVKRVVELDENGQPKRWEVITKRQYELDRDLLNEAILAKKWNNDLDRQFEGLNVGDLYIDDLRHNVPEYDEKGNIIGYFTEYMMPPHFEEDMREYLKTGVINDELLRAFGVRIPSQDKHSFVTLRLVDFMPANYGSTGVFPHELIEISGADFDIDKLYMHIVDSYKKNGKRIAYGTAVTNKDKFAEYVYYMAKKDRSVKAKMAELKKITAFYDETEDRYEIDGEIEPVTTYDDVQDLAHDLFSSEVSAKNMMEIIALKELGLPSNVDEYIKYVEDKGELNNGVLNNRILDAKIKLANNERMVLSKNGKTPIAFQVAETKPLEDIIDSFIERFPILHDILIEDSADVDSIRGQFYSFKNNKEGSRNIGPAVNAMLVYALMNAYKVQIRKQNAKGESMFVLNIDGKDFDSYGNSREWNDNTKTHDGERIAYHISAIVSAMTDNAKERLAARLGLNFNAIGVVSNMVALGVPLETAIMFNLQPSVREFYELISLTNNNIKTSEERDIYKKDVGENILKKINSKRSRKEEERLTFPVTTQLLEDNIKTVGDNADVDYSIFKTFFDFYKQTEAFSSVAQIMKLTQGLGTSNEDIDKIDEVEEKLGFNMPESEFLSSNIPFDVRQVLRGDNPSKPHNNIIAGLIRIKNEIKELQKSIMIERSYLYKRLYETVLENLHIHSKEETFEKTLKKDIIAYLGIKSYMNLLKTTGKGVKLSGLDNALIYDAAALQKGEEYEDIITAVQKMRETDPENAFLKFINAVPAGLKDIETGEMFRNPKGKFGINTLLVNTWASLDLAKINKIEDGLMELYSNVKTRPYVYKLFNYLLVKDGGQFKNGSFIRFMPPAMFKELLDATGNAQELLRYDNAIKDDEAYKEVFGATAMEIFNEFTKLYTTNANNSFNVKIVNPKATPDEKVERIPGYEPEVFKYNNDRIELDIFKGIRKKEPQLVTDENGNEFIMELVSTGKFTSDELKKLDFNNELLKAHGFNIVQKTDDKGKKKYYIALPYTIKIVVSDDLVNGRQFAYYKLSNVSKTKQDPNSPGIGNFIMDVGDNMALGSKAVYEKFEPEGARDQWKVGGLTGEMPTQKVLRDRYGKKKVGYDEVEYADDLEYYEAQLEGLPDFQLEEPVQDLDKDWGIKTKMMGNTVTYYKLVKGKEVVYDAKGAKSPQELLDRLNKEYQESGGKSAQGGELKNAYTEKVVPVEPTLPEVGENVDLSGQSEAATNKLKAMLAAKKGLSSEVNDQKNEKDKGCS